MFSTLTKEYAIGEKHVVLLTHTWLSLYQERKVKETVILQLD